VATLFANPRYTPVDAQGDPYPGATLTFYAAGTTTPQPVYTTSAATVPHPNPVTANSAGQFPPIYYDDALQYRALLRDATGVLLWDIDLINSNLTAEEIGRALYTRTTAENSANVTPTAYRFPPGDVRRYGAVANGTADDTAAFQTAARAVNGVLGAGAVPGGRCFVPNGTYRISRVGIRGTVFVGESRDGVVINGIGAGTASEFMFDAALDLDGSTANTVGGGWVENMTIDANGSNRSLVRTYGGGAKPETLILRDATAAGAYGLSMGLPIWATPKNIYAVNCDIGFHTYSGAGDNATSTTFQNCWADLCLTHGFHLTQLYYSSLINCVSQNCGTNNFYVQGNVNGAGPIYSLQFVGCGTEGNGRPFNLRDCRDVTVINPRVISPASGMDLMLLDNYTGTIIDFSTPGALAGGAFHLQVQNHAGGSGSIVVVGGDVTYPAADSDSITLIGAAVNGGTRTVTAHSFAINTGSGTKALLSSNREQNSQSANYTLVLADAGKQVIHPDGAGAGDTFTIPANASVAFPIGTEIVVINRDSNTLALAITTDTLIQAGTSNTGTRTLAANAVATLYKVSSETWLVDGPGIT
jgi:hypothetical protein